MQRHRCRCAHCPHTPGRGLLARRSRDACIGPQWPITVVTVESQLTCFAGVRATTPLASLELLCCRFSSPSELREQPRQACPASATVGALSAALTGYLMDVYQHIPAYTSLYQPIPAYMMTMTISEARAALPEVVDRVGRGEEITITRHGRPVAVVVRPGALRSRRAEQALRTAEQTRELLETGRRSALSRSPGITADRADELVSAIRTDRDALP